MKKKTTVSVEETTPDVKPADTFAETTTVAQPEVFTNPNAFPAPAGEAETFAKPVIPYYDSNPIPSAPAEPYEDLDDMFSPYGLKPSELNDEVDDLFNPNSYQPIATYPSTASIRRPGNTGTTEPEPRQNTPAIVTQNGVANITPDKSFWQKWGAWIVILVIVLVAIGIIAFFVNLGSHKTAPKETTAVSTAATVETTVTPTVIPTAVPTQTPQEAAVNDELTAASWQNDWFDLTEVNLLEDKSTTADGAFYKAGVRTPDEIVAYLQTGTDSANALLAAIIDITGSTRESILDPKNWVAIQSNVDFTYPGNTGYVNGQIVDLGSRTGNKGDIFLGYVSPETGKIVFVRAACANPQAFTPVPNSTPTPTPKPTPTPTITLTPKDPKQDPAAQGNAPVGSGVNQNPGPGVYVAPSDMVTPPAESRVNPTPPVATPIPTTAAATTAATTTKVPVATPTPTPVDVAAGDPTSVGTPAIPN